ncbi:NADH-quinone oxidoreductase subunit NuoE [Tepidibacter formicigenes]|jgi:NADH-quinone oxidoreductase subunit E|uniref:NAD(P)-dependent iron-only hydrogenase diaphorase component iron-sulfur protein n=1 Tax=Tepidibacter formicigenes DSM 15518 TaxID=1123349 RepID=A0A1M6RNU3_9FIRM|nr:NADH-quinone oxidoreductase subunit NuoE [Tepidibacter formicigenes]SHK34136.1 NAD(P)-dependent iron-only hydrogenase diaphorase component iron-sulfur protein [Tepidibacter formicigenes DSM 15518]
MSNGLLGKEKFEKLEKFISSIPNNEGALIEVLHKAQHIFGYLPKEVQLFISEKLNLPSSKVFGVVSFYSYFTTKPRGKFVINVCLGTVCFVKGADKVMEEFEKQLDIKCGETTSDGKFTLEGLRCVGACGLAPVVVINDKVYGHVTKEDVSKILSNYKNIDKKENKELAENLM